MKDIKAKGLLIYFITLNILFVSIAGGIVESRFLESIINENNFNLGMVEHFTAEVLFSEIGFISIIIVTILFSITLSIIILLISNLVFFKIYFQNIGFTKEELIRNLNIIKIPVLLISLFIFLFPSINNSKLLLIASGIYYIILWLSSYITLKVQINKNIIEK